MAHTSNYKRVERQQQSNEFNCLSCTMDSQWQISFYDWTTLFTDYCTIDKCIWHKVSGIVYSADLTVSIVSRLTKAFIFECRKRQFQSSWAFTVVYFPVVLFSVHSQFFFLCRWIIIRNKQLFWTFLQLCCFQFFSSV